MSNIDDPDQLDGDPTREMKTAVPEVHALFILTGEASSTELHPAWEGKLMVVGDGTMTNLPQQFPGLSIQKLAALDLEVARLCATQEAKNGGLDPKSVARSLRRILVPEKTAEELPSLDKGGLEYTINDVLTELGVREEIRINLMGAFSRWQACNKRSVGMPALRLPPQVDHGMRAHAEAVQKVMKK